MLELLVLGVDAELHASMTVHFKVATHFASAIVGLPLGGLLRAQVLDDWLHLNTSSARRLRNVVA